MLSVYSFDGIEIEDESFYSDAASEELTLKQWVDQVPIRFHPEGVSENNLIKKDIQDVLLEVFKNYPDILKGLIEGVRIIIFFPIMRMKW